MKKIKAEMRREGGVKEGEIQAEVEAKEEQRGKGGRGTWEANSNPTKLGEVLVALRRRGVNFSWRGRRRGRGDGGGGEGRGRARRLRLDLLELLLARLQAQESLDVTQGRAGDVGGRGGRVEGGQGVEGGEGGQRGQGEAGLEGAGEGLGLDWLLGEGLEGNENKLGRVHGELEGEKRSEEVHGRKENTMPPRHCALQASPACPTLHHNV